MSRPGAAGLPVQVAQSSEPTRRLDGWVWPGAVFCLGLLSISALSWNRYLGEQQLQQAISCDDALRRLEIAVITAHLWLEEHLTGDTSVEVTEIWQDLDQASELVLLVLQGGQATPGERALEPLEDPALRQSAESLQEQLVRLRSDSVQRYRHGEGAGIGSPMDQSFDARFHLVLQGAESLRQRLGARMATHRARDQRRMSWIMVSWAVLVSAAAAALWHREKRCERAEQSLRQREAELRQAQKLEAFGRRAGGIAHDIDNYLGAVRAHCEVASLEQESGAALERRMQRAIATTTKASRLIKQLLAVGRRQPISPRVLDLDRVVARLGGLMRRLLGEKIHLEITGAEDLWNVEIDPGQLEQILVNLLINSRDAMPSGGSIEVSTRNLVRARDGRVPSGHYVCLTVADTGPGIPVEIRDQIFEPFFSTKTERGSSGLGLATVYGIVQQNGGAIILNSEPGRGARFEILLPATSIPVALREEEDDLPDRVRALRVLLVEDTQEMRSSIADMLAALGHETKVVDDAETALEILATDPAFDLLVVDVVMPGSSGPGLVQRLRDQGDRIPGLLVSGCSDDPILQQSLCLESTGFLQKPCSAGQLSRQMAELLEARGLEGGYAS